MKKIIFLLMLLLPSIVVAQPAPSNFPGCVFNAGGVTLTNRQTAPWQCDVNGKLLMNSAASGITIGTSIISGGTNTRILFDDNGVVGENANLTFTKGIGTAAISAVAIGGSTIASNALTISGTSLVNTVNGSSVSSFSLKDQSASSTAPTLIPNKSDSTTGIGTQSSGNLSLIAGGVEQARVINGGFNMVGNNVAGVGNILPNNGSGGELVGGAAASATVPTLLPNGSTTVTGIGAQSVGVVSTIISAVETMRVGPGSPGVLALTVTGTAITMGVTPVFPSSTTGASVQTFTNSPCTNTTTATWIRVNVTGIGGPAGNVFIPACH